MSDESKTQELPEEEEIDLDEILIDNYELMYIVPVSYTSEELIPITEKVNQLVKENQGKIIKQEDLGKLKFAYPIKHQSHGYYQLLQIEMPKENVKELNTGLQLTNEILRFLFVKHKIKTPEELTKEKELHEKLTKKKEIHIEKMKADEKEAKEKPAKSSEKEKVSLEDLDKKLDELLDTDNIV